MRVLIDKLEGASGGSALPGEHSKTGTLLTSGQFGDQGVGVQHHESQQYDQGQQGGG